ncbi:MAG TPA: Crp/Fnr family transcriptional regulator [Yinghuangia sp.]|nr:Crp/Fnr family transcriptional regulator [Yinghuangia sp.]
MPRQRIEHDTTSLTSWSPSSRGPRFGPFPPNSFLGCLGEEQTDNLRQHLHVVYLRSGASLQLAPSRVLYLVMDGLAREVPLIGGAAHTTLRLPGDIIESSAVFDPAGKSVTVHGIRASLLGALPRAVFRRVLTEHPQAMAALARSMTYREKRDMFVNIHVRCGSAAVRIARYLCFLADALGDEDHQIVGFSQADIAQAVNASRASAENFFREQREAGILTTHYRSIRIHDMPGLRAQVGDMPIWRN